MAIQRTVFRQNEETAARNMAKYWNLRLFRYNIRAVRVGVSSTTSQLDEWTEIGYCTVDSAETAMAHVQKRQAEILHTLNTTIIKGGSVIELYCG